MNKDLADLKPIILKALQGTRRHFKTIVFVVVALLYSYLVWQINVLNRRQPDEGVVTQKIQSVKRPTIDVDTAKKLKALEDNSQEVESLFKQARENPFEE